MTASYVIANIPGVLITLEHETDKRWNGWRVPYASTLEMRAYVMQVQALMSSKDYLEVQDALEEALDKVARLGGHAELDGLTWEPAQVMRLTPCHCDGMYWDGSKNPWCGDHSHPVA